jgi:O-antigen/teichoic acid export membrane protein
MTLVLPLMVVNILGAEQNAYFYIGWTVGNLLLMVPIMASFSLFAEGSHAEERLGQEVKRSLKFIAPILVLAILILVLLGDKILLLFGEAYSQNATKLIWIVAISALPLSINQVYFGIRRVQKRMKGVIGLSACIAIITLILSYLLLPRMGIVGAGIAWLVAQSLAAAVIVCWSWKELSRSIKQA